MPAHGAGRLVAVGPLLEQFGGGTDERAKGGKRERAAHRDPAHARLGQLGHGRSPGHGEHVDRAVHLAGHLADVLDAAQAGGVQDIGAGLLIGLQPGDRVGEVSPAVQVVLGPAGQDEGDEARVSDLGGRRDALGRERRCRRSDRRPGR